VAKQGPNCPVPLFRGGGGPCWADFPKHSVVVLTWYIAFSGWPAQQGFRMTDDEKRIRTRARRIWEEEGRPEGRAEIHWNKARESIAVEENLEDTSKSVALPVAEAEQSKEATAKVGGELPTLTDKQKQPPAPKASRLGARRRV
jgi:Protein of unknown function (DUF2934)